MSSSDPNFADRRLAILQEMAETGLAMTYKIGAVREPTGEDALAFSRVAKAVRMTLALEAQFAGDLEIKVRAAAERQAREAAQAPNPRKERVYDAVETLIAAQSDERYVELTEALNEWYFEAKEEALALDRPLGEILTEICRLLDITPDFAAFADDPSAAEMAPAPRPGGWSCETFTPVSGPNLSRPRPAPPDG